MFSKFKGLTAVLAVVFTFVLAGSIGVASAATSPDLGRAASYSVLTGTQVTNSGNTTISGDVGTSPSGGGAPTGFPPGIVGPPGTIHTWDTSAANAQFDQKAVFDTNLAAPAQPCTTGFTAMLPSLDGLELDPGVYCTPVDFTLSGTLKLHGTGSPATDVWIFRNGTGNLVVTGGSAAKVIFTGTGGLPCNVWWRIATTATFDGTNTMVGNILAATSITFGTGATLDGRAFAYSAEVTLLGNKISGPTCSVPVVSVTPATPATNVDNTITVIKQVINDNGGTANYTDFPLFINGNPVNSGESVRLTEGTYTVTETNHPGYARTFTGDCDANGIINHGGINTHDDICTVVNNDIGAPPVAPVPPLISVVKVPSPLNLPAGPGPVTYTYTVKNIGTVPMTDVTLVGDTCSPIVLSYGDTNNDSKLDLNETWIYHCTKTLTQTTKNTVVATGHANGLTAVDVASAIVVVGKPIVPPLIHVVKVPDPLALPAGAGAVTYRYTVTNPGTEPLSNVFITDDKCTGLPGRVVGHPGDLNGNNLLDSNELWLFTCKTNLTQTTTNTAIASGEANGLIATDFALATVVVAVPKLPNTGLPPEERSIPWNIIIASGVFIASILFYVARRKQTN